MSRYYNNKDDVNWAYDEVFATRDNQKVIWILERDFT